MITDSRRIVIKVGTSTITYENGRMNLRNIERLARAISSLMNEGREVILVTSGAIGVGVGCLDLKEKPTVMNVSEDMFFFCMMIMNILKQT